MLFRLHARSLVASAPAKLNLFLAILGPRADGFHELETVMVSIGIQDTLTFTEEESDQTTLRCFDHSDSTNAIPGSGSESEDSAIPTGGDNLIVRAAELLREFSGVSRGVLIQLRKRIPTAAGLAGGSSDAAATLLALNRFWDLRLSIAELESIAARLGSDVGFFLHSAAIAVCRGRGEQVEPIHVPSGLSFVIVRPNSGLSTADVFRQYRSNGQQRNSEPLIDCLKSGQLGRAATHFHNALQCTAERLNPHVIQLRERFSELPVLGHMMSGSGTAYFGLCAGRRHALSVAARLRAMQLGRVFVAQSGP
jgi:4-diphosphocytidyl-2-C-methyl-D-erythritol kinase